MDLLSFVRVPINKQEFLSCKFSPTGTPVRHEAPLGLGCHQGGVTEQSRVENTSMWSQAWH